jgi:hypothetical protein
MTEGGDNTVQLVARPAAKSTAIRYVVEPRDIPASKAARRLHLTLAEFRVKLPELLNRGFPPPDPTTGMFYLPAIDKWMTDRIALTTATVAGDPSTVIADRLRQAPWAR